jgi:hypothetical protein
MKAIKIFQLIIICLTLSGCAYEKSSPLILKDGSIYYEKFKHSRKRSYTTVKFITKRNDRTIEKGKIIRYNRYAIRLVCFQKIVTYDTTSYKKQNIEWFRNTSDCKCLRNCE